MFILWKVIPILPISMWKQMQISTFYGLRFFSKTGVWIVFSLEFIRCFGYNDNVLKAPFRAYNAISLIRALPKKGRSFPF